MFTAAAIVSLALGIGANTAIFSLMDAVILRMMPVHEPERLVQFGRDLSYPLFRQFGQELHCFTDMFAQSSMGRRDVIFDEEPEAVSVEFVSGNYYSVLGVSAFAGRTFDSEIDRNPTPVAVISHAYWKRRFALDPAVIGRSFRWNGRVFTIIGVTPPEFHGVVPGTLPEITLPLSMAGEILDDPAWLTSDSVFWLSGMGRLRAGYTIERAQAEVAAIYSRVIQAEAEHYQRQRVSAAENPGAADAARGLGEWIRFPPLSFCRATAAADGDCGVDPADCLRQSRQSAAGARDNAAARDRRPAGHGRWTWTRPPPDAGRRHAAGDGRGRTGRVAGLVVGQCAGGDDVQRRREDRSEPAAGPSHSRFCRVHLRGGMPAVQPRAGDPGDTPGNPTRAG